MIKVHTWDFLGSKQAWGHASMHIGSTYVSWWPEGEGRQYKVSDALPVYSVEHIHGQTFDDDKRDEEGGPDHTIHLIGLDEPRMLQWWNTFNTPGRAWSTLGQNCSTTVGRALMVGGADDYAEALTGWWHSWNTVWQPADVLRYAYAVEQGLRARPTHTFAVNFVRRFCESPLAFTSITWSMDEEGRASALYSEHGTNAQRVCEVFSELDCNRNSDADDVAECYTKLLMQHGGAGLDAVRRTPQLRNLLIRVMDEGWTTSGEQKCIDFLRQLS